MGWTREDVIRVWKNPECRSTHSVSAVHPSGVGLLEMGNEELQEALGAGGCDTLITSIVPPINFTLTYS
ncbi:MAG: mersacidin/lichenicidin family type 2 lantibiotic [Kyrpidia tusciae]|nr:mersacidin/lichenicidin family type 2 lantibiotic [Kyrpidia tusciae]MBE3552560.1 mersacidin/lichenicidin family type 2 lantibiotic [Kyrpidia tusciae]